MFIARIFRAPARHLQNVWLPSPQGSACHLLGPVPWEEVPIVGLASLEVNTAETDGARLYEATLKATLRCPQAFCLAKGPTAYLLVTAPHGRRVVLGSPLLPAPYESLSTNIEAKASGSAARTLSVKLKSIYPPQSLRVDGGTRSAR